MSKVLAQRVVLATLPVFLLIGFKWSGLLGVGVGFIGWLLFRVWFNKIFYPKTPAWERPVPPHIQTMQETAKRNAEQKKTLQPATSTVHGRAKWADVATDCPELLVNQADEFDDGIFLGFLAKPVTAPDDKWRGGNTRQALTYRGNAHGLTIAPTRSGKGATSIIPTLLKNNQSAFVLDIKGENWFVTSRLRERRGHQIITINPFNQFGEELGFAKTMTDRFNPLQNLVPDSPSFDADITGIASALIMSEGSSKEAEHFASRARDLVTCLIAHVCSDINQREAGNNNLPYVREILGQSDKGIEKYLALAAQNSHHLVRHNAATFTDTTDGEMKSVLATARTQLSFLLESHIRHFLSDSTFDFSELRKKSMTIYCIMPLRELKTYFRFARLIVQCLFNELYRKPIYTDRSVLVVLDEQTQLKGMEILESSPSLLAGYKVRLWSIFQNIPEMKQIYGDRWETFVSNAGFIQLIGAQKDTTTAKYISEKIGKETVWQATRSQSTQKDAATAQYPFGNGEKSTGHNEGEQFIGVDFLSIQDLASAPKTRGFVILENLDFPVMTAMLPYYQESSDQTFLGAVYAPHPDHNRDAYQWMKDFMQQAAQVSQKSF